jgi:UDP-GlcNAc:undecaprenyl-phosphate/decaprenyl-phosphate GlcNAc-1-phosphate transferase
MTAFVVAMVCIPPLIRLVNKYGLYDHPDCRKEHSIPTPTLGGIAIVAGMLAALTLWYPFRLSAEIIASLFCMMLLFAIGITDDVKDLSAKYKLVVEIGLASIIALCNIRLTSFGGVFGLGDIPVSAQYTITILAIVGITNAFNLIDGIDGLAGGLSFMSLVTLGFFLNASGDRSFALLAFSLAGGVLAFLYFNMNPARIFMGDTGSLVVGFLISILCIRLISINQSAYHPFIHNSPVFALAIVLIPVYDALRVFAERMWKGQSPFAPDRTHVHHLLSNAGVSHARSSRILCIIHALVLVEVYWLRDLKPSLALFILLATMTILKILLAFFIRQKQREGQATPTFEVR